MEGQLFFDLQDVATELLAGARTPSIDDKHKIRKLLAAAKEPDMASRWTRLESDDCILQDVELWVRTTSLPAIRSCLTVLNRKLCPVREALLTQNRVFVTMVCIYYI